MNKYLIKFLSKAKERLTAISETIQTLHKKTTNFNEVFELLEYFEKIDETKETSELF